MSYVWITRTVYMPAKWSSRFATRLTSRTACIDPAWRHRACCSMQSVLFVFVTGNHSSFRELRKKTHIVGIGFGSHGRWLFGSYCQMQWFWTFLSLLPYQLLPNTDSPLLGGHKSRWTEIAYCTEFLFISTLHVLPQTAVIKQWRYIMIRLRLLVAQRFLRSSVFH